MKDLFKIAFLVIVSSFAAHSAPPSPSSAALPAAASTDKESVKAFSLTLENVLSLSREIANHKSSLRICPFTGKDITFNGNKYELRFFSFEVKNKVLSQETTFETLIKDKNLLSQSPKIMDHGYGPLIVFSAPEELKKAGIHFMLILRYHPEEEN